MEITKNVGIWIRVSTEMQAQGDSPEHHEQRARYYAESKGWIVKEVYHLEAVSGKAVIDHPQAKRMIADIKSGKITGLIFSKLARLARSTKQLLEFADIFKQYSADLISLGESIDTSTPAGRMFFTVQSALAQFEREEIASRVQASVPIRAKLGKSLGGAAPYGYRWHGKELIVDEHESTVRRLMYDLFLEHKRKKYVAKLLNEQGYRTRNKAKFSDTTIDRLLRDSIAKGKRRANYTKSLGDKKHWELKPESEWVLTACPAIISEDIWQRCNAILEEQENKRAPRAKKTVQLFSGFLTCTCGAKMYVPSRTQKYSCTSCKKTHIDIADIEEIYYENLKSFLLTKNDLQTFQLRANEAIQSKKEQLQSLTKEKDRLKGEMKNLLALHNNGQIPTDGFKDFYTPLDEQYKQIDATLIETQAQVDFLSIQQLNGDHILTNAENLYERWPALDLSVKRQVVEELTESITIGGEDITIKFGYTPTLLLNTPKGQHTGRGSYWPPT